MTPPISLTNMSARAVGMKIREVPESRMARRTLVSREVVLEPSVRPMEVSSTFMASISLWPAWGTRGAEMRSPSYLSVSTPPKRMVPDLASEIC